MFMRGVKDLLRALNMLLFILLYEYMNDDIISRHVAMKMNVECG